MSTLIHGVAPEFGVQIVGSTREGSAGRKLGFMPHALVTENHFENIGRPSYEAQGRELFVPSEETSVYRGADAAGDAER